MSNRIEGGLWRHYKGGLYRVICRGRDANDGRTMIVYQDIGTGRIYVRAEVEWMQGVPDPRTGLFVGRFQRVSDIQP